MAWHPRERKYLRESDPPDVKSVPLVLEGEGREREPPPVPIWDAIPECNQTPIRDATEHP